MITQIDVAELGPKFEELVDELQRNGGEICLTRDGKIVAKLVRVEMAAPSDTAPVEGKVFYNGRWMIPAAAERDRSIEHLRGSVKILGDIVSPIDDVEWDALK
jgi:antitoxin (DNA-binding transcriptional repressor) of toxin-antitoxin stability system